MKWVRNGKPLLLSYCIWNRYCQNHRRILGNFLLFVWFGTMEFNSLPCPNDKMYDDAVFADRLRYQLSMFEECILIGLSRLLHTHITYEIVIPTSSLVTGIMRKTISHAVLWWNASVDGDNRYIDGRREYEEIRDSREIWDCCIS